MNDSDQDVDDGHSKKIIGLSVVLLAVALVPLIYFFWPAWYQNYAPEQPIPFSHKIHAGKFNVPCLYCHPSAEQGAHAGVPGLGVCMNCHSSVKVDSPLIQKVIQAYKEGRPIQWVKVHVLPDFVHFKHRPHIAAGVPCQQCHGEIQNMDRVKQWGRLTMGWCVECHRNNQFVQPHRAEFAESKDEMMRQEKTGSMALADRPWWFRALSHSSPHNADVSCSTCHY